MNSDFIPDDEIDDLFREHASQMQSDFDPLAWKELEERLNERIIRRAFKRKIYWLFALLLLVGSVFWTYHMFYAQNEDQKRISATIPSAHVLATPDVTNDKQDVNRSKPDALNRCGKSNLLAPDLTHQLNLDQETGTSLQIDQPVVTRMSVNSRTKNNNLTLEKTNNETTNNHKVKAKKRSYGLLVYYKQAKVLKDSYTIRYLSAVTPKLIKPDLAQKRTVILKLISPDSITAVSHSDSAAKVDTKKPLLAFNRFSFNLLLAPDLSMVGLTNPGSITPNYGLMVTYFLSRNWSINMGLERGRKIYDARPEDYKVKGKWKGISAECKVLDLPINVGLKILQKKKSAFTLTTGVSSYFMLYEKYDYEYSSTNSGRKTYEVSNQNQHLFSIYNLSGIYSRGLNHNLYFGIEPFVKVPLTGVGAGKVKLACTGVLFSINYKPFK